MTPTLLKGMTKGEIRIEQEWLAATDPAPMLRFLGANGDFRSITLFCCACCRSVWDQLDPETQYAVEQAERHAGTNFAVIVRLKFAGQNHAHAAFQTAPASGTEAYANAGTISVQTMLYRSGDVVARQRADAVRAVVIREIAGNPFRLVAADLAWLTSDVIAVAEGVYQERAFDRLPILADALQDAGCDNDDILSHCHSKGSHVRGCWVVDLLTGRK